MKICRLCFCPDKWHSFGSCQKNGPVVARKTESTTRLGGRTRDEIEKESNDSFETPDSGKASYILSIPFGLSVTKGLKIQQYQL